MHQRACMCVAACLSGRYPPAARDPVMLPDLVASGALLDLRPYVSVDGFSGAWHGIHSRLRRWSSSFGGGSIYAVPLGAGSLALHYRADVLALHGLPVPETWEQLLAALRAVNGKPVPQPGGGEMVTYGLCTIPVLGEAGGGGAECETGQRCMCSAAPPQRCAHLCSDSSAGAA